MVKNFMSANHHYVACCCRSPPAPPWAMGGDGKKGS